MTCAGCGGSNPEGMKFCGHCGSPLSASAARPTDALRRMVSRQVAERLAAGGEISDEWRLVTTLFADISGYVALSERLDPEELVDATAPIVTLMTSVAERYEAHVAKFAGDALLCMFGAPVVHEDDADRALCAALDMRAELDALRPSLPPEAQDLELHIGVNTGRVVAAVFGADDRVDYNVAGEAVNLAQRLESAAPGGEIYVGDPTVRLTRDRFQFERVGELTVKGISQPVLAWRLLARRVTPARTTERSPLVGRAMERAAVAGVVARLGEHGDGAVVTISGEAGAGKSRLADEAAASARSRGLGVATLRFGSVARGPLEPFADLIAGLAEPHGGLEGLLARAGAETERRAAHLRAVAGDGPQPDGEDPRTFARRAARAMRELLSALARQQPLVVLVEDVHWAGESAVAIVEDVAAAARGAPVALIATARPHAAATLERIAGAVRPSSRVPLALGALDEDSVLALVRRMLGGDEPPPAFARAVAERAGGNPYFVEEIVRSSIEQNAIARSDDRWVLTRGWDASGVPPTIEGVIAARIDRLPPEAAGVLHVAAVAGRSAGLPLLRAVLGDTTDVEGAAQVVAAAGLASVRDDETLEFHHALVAEVVYERLLRRRRTELHRVVADAAERMWGNDDDVVDLLAHHRYLAGDREAAAPLLVRAGERARRLFANDRALQCFERAAEIADPSDIAERLLDVADLCDVTGDYAKAQAAYERAREAGGGVRAWSGIAAVLRKRGEYAPALALLDRAIATTGDHPALRLEQGWTLSVAGRYPDAIASLHAGLAAGDNDGVAPQLLLELARAETVERELESAIEHAEAARAMFDAREDLHGVTASLRVAGAALQRLGRLDESAAALREGLALAERIGSVEEEGACLINLGMVELERGALDEAIACDRRAIVEFERIGHGSGRAIGYGNLAEKLVRAGSLDEAAEWCDRALSHAAAIEHTPTIADATRTLAVIALQRGDRRRAASLAAEAAALYERMGVDADAADARRLERTATGRE